MGSYETLLAFVIYALVTSITPGPNNMMLLASGVNFGLTRSIPHMLGISLGFGLMVLIVGAGLGAVFEAYPQVHTILRWVGAAYLLYLAWRIANSSTPDTSGSSSGRPLSFLSAAAFQWVNPKAWIMALGAIATYLPPHPSFGAVAALAIVFAAVNAPCVGVWAAFGVGLRRFITDDRHVKVFNVTMALLLVGSLYPIFQSGN